MDILDETGPSPHGDNRRRATQHPLAPSHEVTGFIFCSNRSPKGLTETAYDLHPVPACFDRWKVIHFRGHIFFA